jgi:hypothetical protein
MRANRPHAGASARARRHSTRARSAPAPHRKLSALTRPVRVEDNRCARRESAPVAPQNATGAAEGATHKLSGKRTVRAGPPIRQPALSSAATGKAPGSALWRAAAERRQDRPRSDCPPKGRAPPALHTAARRNLSGTEDRGAMHEASTGTAPAAAHAWPFSFPNVPRPP